MTSELIGIIQEVYSSNTYPIKFYIKRWNCTRIISIPDAIMLLVRPYFIPSGNSYYFKYSQYISK